MKELISKLIQQILTELHLPDVEFAVEQPQIEAHGDFATNVAMILFPLLRKEGNDIYKSPRELAETIASRLRVTSNESEVKHVEVAGPGFINFTLNDSIFINELKQINEQKDAYGKSTKNQGMKVIVEYSSPNIAKPFTIGHLRSTIIGDSIANLKEATGWKVYRDNHLGDWGTQFGKLICAIKKNWIPLSDIELSDHPVKQLVALYVKFHQEAELNSALEDEGREWFKKLEEHDQDAWNLWKQCIDWSWKEFSRIYSLLGISFSAEFNEGRGLGESFFEDKMTPIIDELKSKNLLQTGLNGAQLVFFPNDTYPPLMILKKDGATLYATRDLATDKYRHDKFNPDLIINEVGAEQSLYFKQLFEIESKLGWFNQTQRIHVGHGLYRFAEGKMSTRKGNVIWLEDVLHEAGKRALQVMDQAVKRTKLSDAEEAELGMVIGIGALKWNDLKGDTKRDIVFDWDEILTMRGNSGPYVQYTYARAHSVIDKASIQSTDMSLTSPNIQLNSEEFSLVRWLPRFPEAINQAEMTNSPSVLATYIYELAQRFNTFYNKHSILGNQDNPVDEITKHFRLQITEATEHVLKNGLHLLGIQTPERM